VYAHGSTHLVQLPGRNPKAAVDDCPRRNARRNAPENRPACSPTPSGSASTRATATKQAWSLWGPYLSDRQWGTVREDYSADGDAWNYFPFEHARSRAYRWGEDGIFGICDDRQRLCFAPAFWNGNDPILKERFFGLSGPQGNHGEDVKEQYYYLDNVPSHAYMRALYKYPQARFPYEELLQVNAPARATTRVRVDRYRRVCRQRLFRRHRRVRQSRARRRPDRVDRGQPGRAAATLHLVPQLWFRNEWSWTAGERSRRSRRPEPAAGRARRTATRRSAPTRCITKVRPTRCSRKTRPTSSVSTAYPTRNRT
jgi:hypothetical protein